MKQEKKSFRHESLQDAQSIEKILAAISESLGKGKLKFSDEEDEIIFQPEGLMKLKLTAAQDGNEQRFNIKVNWQLDSDKLKNKTIKVEH
ncbi:MAG: amphi-Trp domain-containing protein [Methyloprofundus sp.]|nr:amphi-Trp domain-containing protein [Methyloprofundus sp.]